MPGPQRSLDTSEQADAVQLAAYRRLGGAGRVAIAFRLSALVRDTAVAGILQRHPDYSSEQAARAFQRLVLGDALMRDAFPQDDLVEP